MIRIASLVAVALIATSSMAFAKKAKTYSLQDTDYCDHVTLTVAKSLIVGVSDASCGDDGYLAGTVASTKVAPGGSVLAVGGDLGVSPLVAQIDYSLSQLEVNYYFTVSGTSVIPVSSGLTEGGAIKNNHAPRVVSQITR